MTTRASLTDIARIRQHGYTVERTEGLWTVTGRMIRGWTLLDHNDPVHAEGDQLMIGDHGCVAPTQWEAVAEALSRIEQDERLARESNPALEALRYHVSGAVERGEAESITEQRAGDAH